MKRKTSDELDQLVSQKTFQGEVLKGQISLTFKDRLSDQIIEALNGRFPVSEVVESCLITSFYNWPLPENKEAIIEFGEHSVATVKTLMKDTLTRAGTNHDEIDTEWAILKSLIYQRFERQLTVKSLTWREVFQVFHDDEDLQNVMSVVDLLLSLPSTSVNNESTFSRTKLTKGKRRGHLKTSTLNDLMQVVIESPPIEKFDPRPSIERWMKTESGRRRRVGFTKKNVVKVSEEMVPDPEKEQSELPEGEAAHVDQDEETLLMQSLNLEEEMEDDDDDSDDEENEIPETMWETKLRAIRATYEE